jgi:hypothetical protein
MENKLWYNTAPKEWMEGLPIGNGRLAAMIWGNENTDQISLNHEWLWRGVNRMRDNEQAFSHLEEVRNYLERGDFSAPPVWPIPILGALAAYQACPTELMPISLLETSVLF